MTIASLDIGTNTILLLVAEVNNVSKKINVLSDLHRVPRIGKGLKAGNPFPQDNVKRMFEVLDEYSEVINRYNCEKIILSGTNAFRIASDSQQITAQIKYKYGYDLNILKGKEEAELSYLGAVSSYADNGKYLVIDIGGGSTEIIYGNGNNIIYSKSFFAGVVSGSEKYLISDPPEKNDIDKYIVSVQNIFSEMNIEIFNTDTAIAIAGTPTTLAAIKQKLKHYNENKVEGSTLSSNELKKFINVLSQLSSEEILLRYSQIVKGREDVLLAGTIILKEVLNILNINEVKVSTKGIRYGAIIKLMNSFKSIE